MRIMMMMMMMMMMTTTMTMMVVVVVVVSYMGPIAVIAQRYACMELTARFEAFPGQNPQTSAPKFKGRAYKSVFVGCKCNFDLVNMPFLYLFIMAQPTFLLQILHVFVSFRPGQQSR